MNSRSKNLIAYMLSKFEICPEPIVLIKLVYLSELEAIKKYGKRFTDLTFIHYKHGPYSSELQNFYKNNKRISYNPKEKHSDPDLLNVAEAVVNKWKPIVLGGGIQGLINKTYHTLPFQETAFNETIEFEKYKGNKYILETVVSNKKYKQLSNPNIKLYSNKKLQNSVNEFLEQFN
jgi:hypothetical protein